jgi:hypothetical protein
MLYKNLSFIAAFCALIFINSGCKKYEPQYEGAWTDAQVGSASPLAREIVYVQGNSIYLTDRYNTNPKLVATNATYQNIDHIAFSPKHDKIAFTRSTDWYLCVMDTLGQTLTPNIYAQYLKYFEWHSDNKLLYGLQNGNLKSFYGGTLPVGLPAMPNNLSPTPQFGYITPENDLFYTWFGRFRYIKNGQTQFQEVYDNYISNPYYFRRANGTNTGITTDDVYSITIVNRSITRAVSSYADTEFAGGNYMRENNGYLYYFLDGASEYDDKNSTPIQTSVYDIK